MIKGRWIFYLALILFTALNATTIEDKAYEAYMTKNYRKSLKLYKEAAKADSLKSYLMIGLFLEKGLGVEANKQKAIKVYKLGLKKAKKVKKSKEELAKINIAIAILKRLYVLTNNEAYNNLMQKLIKVKIDIQKQESSSLNLHIDDYYAMCPDAKVVPIENAEGIEKIDCQLFEHFPDRMATFMKLKKQRDIIIKNNKNDDLYSIDKKISRVIKPVLKHIEQLTIECYNSANYFYDVQACDYNYLTQSDPLLFENRAYKMEQAIANENSKDYKISSYEKEKLINSLIYQFSTQDYEKKSYHMVKL